MKKFDGEKDEEKKLFLYEGKQNRETTRVKRAIEDWAKKRQIPLEQVTNQKKVKDLRAEKQKSFLLSLGGDGTFLRVADLVAPYRIPILGINLGNLGFLTGLDSSRLKEGLEEVLMGDYEIVELTRLRCRLENNDQQTRQSFTYTALNEIVASKGKASGLAEIELLLDSKKVATYPGDGLIVSTPTGSTAYSLSCGGPLITRNTSAFAITPLNVHKLGLRPIICSTETDISLKAFTPLKMQADGKKIGNLEKGATAEIRKSDIPTLMVVPTSRSNFFETVRSKLNWDQQRGTTP